MNDYLILLSLLIALVSSLGAFGVSATAHSMQTQLASLWLVVSAAAMASMVWATHFAGVMALSQHGSLSYDFQSTALSWLVMAVACCLILRIANKPVLTTRAFIGGSVLAGVGVSGMYYASTQDLHTAGGEVYGTSLFTLFVSMLVTLCVLVMLLAFWIHTQKTRQQLAPKLLATVLLMTAAGVLYYLIPATGVLSGMNPASKTPVFVAILISLAAIALIAITSISSMIKSRARAYPFSWDFPLRNNSNELSRMALLDTLTQLPNRRLFQQHLEVSIGRTNRMGNSLAVAFIDLDGFKPINDTLGHHIGDKVLLAVAKRLNAAVRGCDVVARIGGDEFVALIEDIDSNQDIVPIVERILQSLRDVFDVDGHEIAISASVGIAVYPRDGNIERMLVCADAAMYRAKSDGKNQFRFFDAEIELASDRLQEMQRDLGQALAKDEFKLHFQPKIDSKTNALVGVEALLRWQHPIKGMIAPGIFIPAAERFGLINQIGDWVIEESCRIIHRLRNQGLGLKIAINLSAQQFRNPQLVSNTLQILQRFDLPSSSLMFEIIETSDLHNQDQYDALVGGFMGAGIDVAIGNFGSGISSLSYLQNIHASELKLDRTFISEIHSDKQARAVVGAIIRLAHALKFRVVAEGVETEDQRKILVELGCNQQQGYLFSRPVPEEKLVCLIRQLEALASDRQDSLS